MPVAITTQEILAACGVATAIAAIVALLEGARNTRRHVEALDMPFVILKPQRRGRWIEWEEAADTHRMLGKLWNVGRGPAIVGGTRLTIDSRDLIAPAGEEIPIGAGDTTRHSPELLGAPPEGPGELRIYYTHVSGREYMTRSVAIAGPDGLLCTDFKRENSDRQGRRFAH